MICFVFDVKVNSKRIWWTKLRFEVLDSQRVACFPPSIPGLPEGRKAGCCRMGIKESTFTITFITSTETRLVEV